MQEEILSIPVSADPAQPVRGRAVRSKWLYHVMTFLMVFGPGLIVMEADNDAGAVSTYVQAGAQYGTRLLWVLLLLLPVTYFIQEMVVRLGIVTGKGHATMIYQRFGRWWGLFSLVDLQLVNFLTLVTEFAAISSGIEPHEHCAASGSAAGSRGAGHYGAHRQLPAMGADHGVSLPAGPGMDIYRVEGAAAVRGDFLQHCDPRNTARRAYFQPDVSGDRDRGYDHRSVAAVLSAELHRR